MSARLPRPVAAAIWAWVVTLVVALAFVTAKLPLDLFHDGWAVYAFSFIALSWSVVGAFLATRRPENGVGWTVFVIGTIAGVSLFGQAWSKIAPVPLGVGTAAEAPGAAAGAVVGILFNVALLLMITALPLVFPDGRLPSRRWRPLLAVIVIAIAVLAIASLLRPGPTESVPEVDNPIGIPALADATALAASVASTIGLLCAPLCVAAAVLRYRRGSPIERQQLKWFGAAAGLSVLGIIGASVLPQPLGIMCFVGFTISVGLVPVAIAVAVLRYRLYEIDRLVGRTVSYAVVTAILAAAFLGTNLLLQAVLADATGSSTLTTAAATLVVAALFQPLRRRVQGAVDRRFNRRRADADRVVGRFSASVREHVDLDSLRGAIASSVNDAVAPTGMSIWLRGNE